MMVWLKVRWCEKSQQRNCASTRERIFLNAVSANCNFGTDEVTRTKVIIGHKLKEYQELKIIYNYSSHIVHDSLLEFLSWTHEAKSQTFAICKREFKLVCMICGTVAQRDSFISGFLSNEVIVDRASELRRREMKCLFGCWPLIIQNEASYANDASEQSLSVTPIILNLNDCRKKRFYK